MAATTAVGVTSNPNHLVELSNLFDVIEAVLKDELNEILMNASTTTSPSSVSSPSSPTSSSTIGLHRSHIEQLLQAPSTPIWAWRPTPASELSHTLPMRPYFKEIGYVLYLWTNTKQYPLSPMTSLPHLVEVPEKLDSITKIAQTIEEMGSRWSSPHSDLDAKKEEIRIVLKTLGLRGILTLMRLRHTIGSVEAFPVDREMLEDSFNQRHTITPSPSTSSSLPSSSSSSSNSSSSSSSSASPSSSCPASQRPPYPKKPRCIEVKLTVGARALAKHCHRCRSSWWGKAQGPEEVQNQQARQVLLRILTYASWINIHSLPHDVKVLEVRTKEGYGVRWFQDPLEFRGFLEPQMPNGHQNGE